MMDNPNVPPKECDGCLLWRYPCAKEGRGERCDSALQSQHNPKKMSESEKRLNFAAFKYMGAGYATIEHADGGGSEYLHAPEICRRAASALKHFDAVVEALRWYTGICPSTYPGMRDRAVKALKAIEEV